MLLGDAGINKLAKQGTLYVLSQRNSEMVESSDKSCRQLFKFVQLNISQTYLGREYSPTHHISIKVVQNKILRHTV